MTFHFERTTDVSLIRDTILSPNNVPWAFPNPLDQLTWNPQIRPEIYYIACYHNDRYMGLVAAIKQSETVCEGHIAFLPCAYGKSVLLGKECLSWIWGNTPFDEMLAPVVPGNKLAVQFLERVGFSRRGTLDEDKDLYWISNV